jgi:hypothetical protein
VLWLIKLCFLGYAALILWELYLLGWFLADAGVETGQLIGEWATG